MNVDDLQLTRIPRAPGSVNDRLTWVSSIDQSLHPDHSIDDVYTFLVSCSYTLLVRYLSSQYFHGQMALQAAYEMYDVLDTQRTIV